MDYQSNSSDFEFPADTGLCKLSSPLSFKVPESRDWALDEFMQTLQKDPHTEAEKLLSFKHYIPVNVDDDLYDDDLPKSLLAATEEKELSNLSHLLEVLKDGFTLVQNDIQSNNTQNRTTFTTSTAPGPGWFDEAMDYGDYEMDNLDTVESSKPKNYMSPPEETESICSEQSTVEEPLPTLSPPPAPTNKLLVQPTTTGHQQQSNKGFKNTVKQFRNLFNSKPSTTTKSKTTFVKNTKKFIRNIF